MNPINQKQVEELFQEKNVLRQSLMEAKKHDGWKTIFVIKSTMAQIRDFNFDYQEATKLILPMIIKKIETRISEIDKELLEL